MCIGQHAKYPLFMSDFNETCIFIGNFEKKNTKIPNFMKIHQVGSKSSYANGRTDTTKLIIVALAPPGFDPRIVLFVDSFYPDYDILDRKKKVHRGF